MRWWLLISVLLVSPLQAAETDPWTELLREHVQWTAAGHASVVDYEGFAAERERLKAYLGKLSTVERETWNHWPDDRQLAFLINAYNAFTVELILRHYPDIDSIRDIGNWFKGPWDIAFFELLGEERTLDELEHEMIREWFEEPRIHFAVNCASVGCPALRPEAFSAEKLEAQLEDSTRRFLGDRQRNYFDKSEGVLHVSPLLQWYDEDFESAGGVKGFLGKYAQVLGDDSGTEKRIREGGYRLKYSDYDWKLNTPENTATGEQP